MVEIPASQPMLHLTEELADNFPDIIVDEAHKQVPENSLPAASEVSRIDVDQVIYDCQAKPFMTLWQSIQPNLARTPFNQLSLIKADVQKILGVMEEIKLVDSSFLRNMVQEYFAHVKSFDDIKLLFLRGFQQRIRPRNFKHLRFVSENQMHLKITYDLSWMKLKRS